MRRVLGATRQELRERPFKVLDVVIVYVALFSAAGAFGEWWVG